MGATTVGSPRKPPQATRHASRLQLSNPSGACDGRGPEGPVPSSGSGPNDDARAHLPLFLRLSPGARVLEDLSLRLDAGCSVLPGPNGAGKSTLLGRAASTLKRASGHITPDGLDTRKTKDLAAYAGVVAAEA
ncbi:ATP-binding cassette domain-containing protein [Streptomyces sp. B1866]|uniref:ATP-binding cassette domain-containing protein n=1 Tax=Streptomyces sp. B1866 TaxID=3075431 RepID=UPI0034D952AC